jgi:hypothetical protein
VGEVLVHPHRAVGIQPFGDEILTPQRGHVEAFRRFTGPLDQERILRSADDEVGGELDGSSLEEHLEPSFLTPLYAVEHRDEIADHTARVLDGERGRVLHRVAEHMAFQRVDPLGRAEEPRQHVATMDRVLEQRATAGLREIAAPARMAGNDITRRPVLVVAQGVAHRRAELTALDDGAQPVDDRVEPRLEPDLRRDARSRDRRVQLAHDRKGGRERLLGEERLARGRNGEHVLTMEPRRRDEHDRVDVGVGDHIVTVRAPALDAARDARDPFDGVGIGVGRGDERGDAVNGQQPDRSRVRGADHPAADEAEA